MSDPTRLPEKEKAKPTLQAETEEINRLERILAQHGQRPQSLAEVEDPVDSEKLFSRRTLFGWAFATLLVVFAIRMVMPAVFESVKESVVSSMKKSAGNTAVTPVVAPPPPTTVLPAPAVPSIPPGPAATAGPVTTPSKTIDKVQIKKEPQ